MRKGLIVMLLLITGWSHGQDLRRSRFLSLAYEGGFVAHPGFSLGYHWAYSLGEKWSVRPGVKTGAYFHRRYQNAVFLTAKAQLLHSGKKGGFYGFEVNAGFQRHFIPHTFSVREDGSIEKRAAGTNHLVYAPGFLLGGRLLRSSKHYLEWYLNPQLQFRQLHGNSKEFKRENYFLLAFGVNYRL